MNDLWTQIAAGANLTLGEREQQLLSGYLDLLLQANQRMNLTAIRDRAQAELLHIADALTALAFLLPGPFALADVGSGGGVPGIPLAIARPDAHVTLIESTQKKAAFLRQTAATLGLANLAVEPKRAEDLARGELREGFDIAIARGVAPMNLLAEWCLPLVKKGGSMLAMKGARIAEELPAAARSVRILNGAEPILHPIALPGTENHVIVQIRKLGRTDPNYPRPPTVARKKPL